ncbi:MAG: hypothetical protein PW788_01150 [Micavibrio sp.]|nr:hypothetical protein [Micavibrio sp.]
MSAKEDALAEIVSAIRRHNLKLDDIAAALKNGPEFKAAESSSIIARLFGYIGGILVISGFAIYIGMQWDHIDALGRIMLTLGVGFSAFILALVCSFDARLERAATPIFLLAACLESGGILVMLKEFSHGGDPAYGLLFLHFAMALQQGLAFYNRQRTALAFTTIYFTLGFFAVAFDLLHVPAYQIGLVIGFSLVCIGWSLGQSRHRALAGLIYFVGSIMFIATAWDKLDNTAFEPLLLALSCGTIFLSVVARSGTLLLVGTCALIGYIGNFMYDHFRNDLAGPIGLILAGVLLIGIGALAMRINNKYIRGTR